MNPYNLMFTFTEPQKTVSDCLFWNQRYHQQLDWCAAADCGELCVTLSSEDCPVAILAQVYILCELSELHVGTLQAKETLFLRLRGMRRRKKKKKKKKKKTITTGLSPSTEQLHPPHCGWNNLVLTHFNVKPILYSVCVSFHCDEHAVNWTSPLYSALRKTAPQFGGPRPKATNWIFCFT